MATPADQGSPAFIAVDWGSTNRRIFVMDDAGAVLASTRDSMGLAAMAPGDFKREAKAMRAHIADLPLLMAGMVGSARGWVEAAYVACPAGVQDLAGWLAWAEPGRSAIVPGLFDDSGDVMRGEEVQFLGSVAAGLVPGDARVCQPGTHCKWARLAGGRIAGFNTAMTGEIFALLKAHSLLADFMTGPVADGDAFREGVRVGLAGGLLGKLFGVRANVLLRRRGAGESAAYASGLLIGADVGEQQLAVGETVYLLADAGLGALYAAALAKAGMRAVLIDSQAAFAAGMAQIWSLTHDQFTR